MSAVGTMTIGRRSDCEIVLRDKLVSRVHARIIVGAETAAVEDLRSANGVLVNGQRIHGLQRLQPRDEIKIGEQVLEVLGFAEGQPADEDATEMRRVVNLHPPYDEEQQVTTRVTEPPPKTKR
ncbi:MAG TPA: FHA domain-containing protein [Polyangiaceae bacterium]|jgi:pSer/pThr/pTyr-binding forkhead associated (FHA) protein|nr:FHA domain-containing protein [Polyangiaceae bacterium]